MRTHGHIHGEPIRWHTGESAYDQARNLVVIVWVDGRFYMHCRPLIKKRAFMGDDLSRAYFRRELNLAEKELRDRVKRGAQHV